MSRTRWWSPDRIRLVAATWLLGLPAAALGDALLQAWRVERALRTAADAARASAGPPAEGPRVALLPPASIDTQVMLSSPSVAAWLVWLGPPLVLLVLHGLARRPRGRSVARD